MHDTSLRLRYLSEPEIIDVGATDMARCIDTMCEVFSLLATGDYRMGGPNHSSHGIKVDFPLEPAFPGSWRCLHTSVGSIVRLASNGMARISRTARRVCRGLCTWWS